MSKSLTILNLDPYRFKDWTPSYIFIFWRLHKHKYERLSIISELEKSLKHVHVSHSVSEDQINLYAEVLGTFSFLSLSI